MNLNEKEKAILEILEVNPFISQQELADSIGLSRSATANLLSGLQSKGYILGKAYVLNKNQGIICIGGANVDHKLILKDALALSTSNPVSSANSVGGVIRNVAENLGRLGCQVSLMTLLGKDMAANMIVKESKPYMKLHLTSHLEEASTGQYLALLDTKGNMVLGLADMDICEAMDDKWLSGYKTQLIKSEYLVVDCNVTESAISYLLELARSHQLKLIIIGVSSPKMKRLPRNLKGLYAGIFNRDESQSYFNTSTEDAAELAELWLKAGLKKVVVTAGSEAFAYGYDDIIETASPIKQDNLVDVTGAGDSFSAGVIYGLSLGKDMAEAVKYGSINAMHTLMSSDSVPKDISAEILEKEKENYYG